MTGQWNIALLGKHLPVWGEVSAIGVILAIAHTNAMNLYPAVTTLLAVNTSGRTAHRMLQPMLVIILGIFATILAILGILGFIQGFLSALGTLLFPFTFILVVDWFQGRYYADAISSFYATPRRLQEWFLWPAPWAIGMLLAGVLLGGMEPRLPPMLVHVIPWQVCSALAVTVVYFLGLRIAQPRFRRAQAA